MYDLQTYCEVRVQYHAKYESPIFYGMEVMSNGELFQK